MQGEKNIETAVQLNFSLDNLLFWRSYGWFNDNLEKNSETLS